MSTILMVDDSASIRQVVKIALRSQGHTVAEACNGVEALQRAEGTAFDLIITDVNMPEMDGLALTRALRKQPAQAGVPILFLTTESDPAIRREAKAAGATGWITKPFSQDQLCAVVAKVLGK